MKLLLIGDLDGAGIDVLLDPLFDGLSVKWTIVIEVGFIGEESPRREPIKTVFGCVLGYVKGGARGSFETWRSGCDHLGSILHHLHCEVTIVAIAAYEQHQDILRFLDEGVQRF